jgi:hypothetical protein
MPKFEDFFAAKDTQIFDLKGQGSSSAQVLLLLKVLAFTFYHESLGKLVSCYYKLYQLDLLSVRKGRKTN